MEASVANLQHHDDRVWIVVYECCPGGEVSVATLLEGEGRRIVACQDGKSLLDSVVNRRPNAVVAILRRECQGDIGVLHLLRRTIPEVPVIFVANDTSLAVEKVVRDLRPFYYAVAPVDLGEIESAVEAALERNRPAPPRRP